MSTSFFRFFDDHSDELFIAVMVFVPRGFHLGNLFLYQWGHIQEDFDTGFLVRVGGIGGELILQLLTRIFLGSNWKWYDFCFLFPSEDFHAFFHRIPNGLPFGIDHLPDLGLVLLEIIFGGWLFSRFHRLCAFFDDGGIHDPREGVQCEYEGAYPSGYVSILAIEWTASYSINTTELPEKCQDILHARVDGRLLALAFVFRVLAKELDFRVQIGLDKEVRIRIVDLVELGKLSNLEFTDWNQQVFHRT
jgi:hypothetical protein